LAATAVSGRDLTPDTQHLKPKLFISAAMFIKVDGGFFDCIEGDPIPPDGNFALFTGKLNGCVPMVLVTLIIIRVINMFGHFFSLPLFWLPVSFSGNLAIFEFNITTAVCQIRTNRWEKMKNFTAGALPLA
jgi:hypothetical protein